MGRGLGPRADTTAPLGAGLYEPEPVADAYEELGRRAKL